MVSKNEIASKEERKPYRLVGPKTIPIKEKTHSVNADTLPAAVGIHELLERRGRLAFEEYLRPVCSERGAERRCKSGATSSECGAAA